MRDVRSQLGGFAAMAGVIAAGLVATPAAADTSDVTHTTPVVVEKQGEHCADDPNCFNRYHPAIDTVERAQPGDVLVFETRDALDSNLNLESTAEDLAALDLNLVHPMTGPGSHRGR